LLSSGKVLVTGGVGPNGPVASAEIYDPAINAWNPTGEMATPRSSHTATLLASGEVLVAGGCGGCCDIHCTPGASLASAELYDPATATWTDAPPMRIGRSRHTATLMDDGTVLLAGGWQTGITGASATAERFRPAVPPTIPDGLPVTSAAVTPAPNASGWRNKVTTVVLTAAASGGAGISRLTFWATGAQPIQPATVAGSTATVVIASDGATMLRFFAVDRIGRAEPVRTLAIWIDRAPPAAAPPRVGFEPGGEERPTAARVWVFPDGGDVSSGIVQFEVQKSIGGGPYRPLAVLSPAPGYFRTYLETGRSRLRARALDLAGNVGRWVESSQEVKILLASSRSIRYAGSWSTATKPDSLGGKTRFTTQAGASATFTFFGSGVAWVGWGDRKSGRATVCIDGRCAQPTDLRWWASPRHAAASQGWPGSGIHTIEIRVEGTPGRPRVDVDAFFVLVGPPSNAGVGIQGTSPWGAGASSGGRQLFPPVRP